MKKMYEAEIEASHPTRLQTEAGYKADAKAMMLVGERHEKRELVDLIRWLILDNAKTINPLPDSKGDMPPMPDKPGAWIYDRLACRWVDTLTHKHKQKAIIPYG